MSASAGSAQGSSEAGDDPADHLPIRVFDWCNPLESAHIRGDDDRVAWLAARVGGAFTGRVERAPIQGVCRK
ncbi:hypothetical protein OG361_10645 [Streptomyces sp. NBC_00090]|uniref:hypothetical protein n=1 Tax=Streptomyces sp. NBC_00090 TaxID=2903619 RepID=UPI003244631B